MTRRTHVPPEIRGAPLLSRELPRVGVPRSRIRAADVAHPFRGVHVFGGEPADLRERAVALSVLLTDAEAFSHSTAAALWGAPLPHGHDAKLHVTTTGKDQRMRRPGVVGHRSARTPVTMLGELRLVDPAHVFAQLGSVLAHDDLVAVGDYLVTPRRIAKRPALSTIDNLRAAIPDRARGAARARRALADVRVGAESPMETRTRLLLLRAGLPEPVLNPEIDGLHPDLLFRQWMLILEYEGDHHRTDPKQWRRDISRREAFQAAGFRVMQVHADDIFAEPERFLAQVAHAIAQQQQRSDLRPL